MEDMTDTIFVSDGNSIGAHLAAADGGGPIEAGAAPCGCGVHPTDAISLLTDKSVVTFDLPCQPPSGARFRLKCCSLSESLFGDGKHFKIPAKGEKLLNKTKLTALSHETN